MVLGICIKKSFADIDMIIHPKIEELWLKEMNIYTYNE